MVNWKNLIIMFANQAGFDNTLLIYNLGSFKLKLLTYVYMLTKLIYVAYN